MPCSSSKNNFQACDYAVTIPTLLRMFFEGNINEEFPAEIRDLVRRFQRRSAGILAFEGVDLSNKPDVEKVLYAYYGPPPGLSIEPGPKEVKFEMEDLLGWLDQNVIGEV